MGWVTLATYPTQMEAHLLAGRLQEAEIEVNISSSALDEMYPGTSLGSGYSVQVLEKDVEQAKSTIEGSQ